MRVGDAATQAFKMWVAAKREVRIRDRERTLEAAKDIDRLRLERKGEW